jgi:Domain of unknown function (DUF1841)
MQESRLQDVTLLSWTLRVWRDDRRGVPMTGHEAAVAYAMQHHTEWWADWDSIDLASSRADVSIENRLIHIHHDAAIRMQLENKAVKQVCELYEMLRQKGFEEFESIHTLVIALTEETWVARENKESFNFERYIERTTNNVKQTLSRPNLTRIAKAKAY